MSSLSLIAAIDEAGGIGKNNQLLCHLPADLKHFKATTMGKPILMGRHTFESIGKPLPGRPNIVISKQALSIEGVQIINSLDKMIFITNEYPEVMVIGGAQLYNQTISMANTLYITRIHHLFEADVFFPIIDEKLWQCQSEEFRPQDELNKFDMTFCIFERIK